VLQGRQVAGHEAVAPGSAALHRGRTGFEPLDVLVDLVLQRGPVGALDRRRPGLEPVDVLLGLVSQRGAVGRLGRVRIVVAREDADADGRDRARRDRGRGTRDPPTTGPPPDLRASGRAGLVGDRPGLARKGVGIECHDPSSVSAARGGAV
jgi:hypothetical protein